MSAAFQLTHITKDDGPLTKRISLTDGGALSSDGAACVMPRGKGRRVELSGIGQLSDLIGGLQSDQALALGALRPDLPESVTIVTRGKLNGGASPDVIARTSTAITYREKQPALALLDFDTKGMPPEVRARLETLGGFWSALISVVP